MPLSRVREGCFPPAASTRTSGVTQLGESFQAKPSLTAETQLEETTTAAPSLGTLSREAQSINTAHATPPHKRRNTEYNTGCNALKNGTDTNLGLGRPPSISYS